MLQSLVLLLLAGLTSSAAAQDYPSRQITLIAPFAAGGSTDLVARVVSEGLRAKLGQPVIVENKPGGTGVIGAREVVKADPDGYTLLLANAGATVIPAAMSNSYPIDLNKDLLAIGLTAEFVGVVMAKRDLPVNSMQEFIAYAKANPGRINFGSGGVGTAQHVAGELFKMMTGVNMVHVPYRGGAPAVSDLLGGQLQVMFDILSESIEYIRAGRLRPLAVTTATRFPALLDVPTVSEFVPGYEATAWWGVGAPKNTPADIIDKLNREINAGLADPKIRARFADLGGTAMGGSPADFGKLIADETEKWDKVVRAANMKVE
jgi:tripartite-type tricarboxylate transporter receptor subunit TctC